MNDADIKDLINSAVDLELAEHGSAPPLDRSRLAEQPETARPHLVARWSAPLLAAVVAALLTVGAMLAIGFERDQRANPPANSPTPAPWATPSVSRIPEMDLEKSTRAYEAAMAGAREASEVAGVSAGPLSAEDAASSLWSLSGPVPEAPEPGKSYPITVRHLAGPSDEWVSIVSGELRDVASGSCPQPFRVRPGHTYLIRCEVTFLAGVVGKATFAKRGPLETAIHSFNLGNPAGRSASPSIPRPEETSIVPGRQEAARAYFEAVASAPEASKVAGVSELPATAEDSPLGGEKVGVDGSVWKPERGRSYPLTLTYVPPADAPAISVLAMEFEDVAAGRCPGPFRVRPAHAYTLRCQVTFRAGAVGVAYYRVTGPHGRSGTGMTISSP